MRAYFCFLWDLWHAVSVVLMTAFASFVTVVSGMALAGIRLDDRPPAPAPIVPLASDRERDAELTRQLVKERCAHAETALQLDILRRNAIWFPPKPADLKNEDRIPVTALPTIPEDN